MEQKTTSDQLTMVQVECGKNKVRLFENYTQLQVLWTQVVSSNLDMQLTIDITQCYYTIISGL